jgi:rubrerythrin
MADSHTIKENKNADKDHLQKKKERDSHEGPWICDRCGNWARTLENDPGPCSGKNRNYACGCGGNFWPGK